MKQLTQIAGDTDRWALFLDFDGTLVEIARKPDEVQIDADTITRLDELGRLFNGAVALVSGRTLADLDSTLGVTLPFAIGGHGSQVRRGQGQVESHMLGDSIQIALNELAENLSRSHPRALLELKPAGLALHYRTNPADREELTAAAEDIVERFPGQLRLQPGNMVIEIKPCGIDKGAGIAELMSIPPFCGRKPIFFGDDLTDEAGFTVVNALGGMSVIVGDRTDTSAALRLRSPREVLGVLRDWVQSSELRSALQ
ncbi:MAG: trehalose-phosphatase [bacterium]